MPGGELVFRQEKGLLCPVVTGLGAENGTKPQLSCLLDQPGCSNFKVSDFFKNNLRCPSHLINRTKNICPTSRGSN